MLAILKCSGACEGLFRHKGAAGHVSGSESIVVVVGLE